MSKRFMSVSVRLSLSEDVCKLKLQCRPDAELDLPELGAIVGLTLPTSPNELSGTAPAVFWTAPSEWLIVLGARNVGDIRRQIETTLNGTLYALTDLSDGMAVIEVSGPGACTLLSEDCGIDLDQSRFVPGRYAATRLAQVPVIIHHTGADLPYRVYVDRSLVQYLWGWLEDGARLIA